MRVVVYQKRLVRLLKCLQVVSDLEVDLAQQIKIYVSIAALTLATVLASTANAIIQEPGTFVPEHCGDSNDEISFEVSVKSACVGKVAGESFSGHGKIGGAVLLKLTDGSEQVLRVKGTASPLMAYANGTTEMTFFLENEDGQRASMKILKSSDGEISNAIGQYGTATFFIPHFENVFVIQ